jgi:wobble nucleotide-excising tRNase
MIKKIDIKKFGLFNDFKWDAIIGKQEEFRRLNILYGRNYSGKTTLARIFKCLEDSLIHKNYLDGEFKITMRDGMAFSNQNITDFSKANKLRVYNKDFVNENLSWLYNEDGSIKPFTILGAKNIELDKKIKEIEEALGSIEEAKGLLFDSAEAQRLFTEHKSSLDAKKASLTNRLKDKAVEIKNNSSIYNYPLYIITTIKNDIPEAIPEKILTDEQTIQKKILLKEESKIEIDKLLETKPDFNSHYNSTRELLQRQIKTTEPIADLINDALLQEWVRHGIDKHKGKRENCGFCGNPLPKDLWAKLDAHFSKESEDLRNQLAIQVKNLELAKENLKAYLNLEKDKFYITLVPQYEELLQKWKLKIEAYSKNLDILINKLKEREQDIFSTKPLPEIENESENILSIIKEINVLIAAHNLKTNTLVDDQEAARYDLRVSEVAKFLRDIEYDKLIAEIESSQGKLNDLEIERTNKGQEINILLAQKKELEVQAKDESKGAELVNRHLTHFFGHDELKLIAEGTTPNIRFKITRDTTDANNLSEGECSLISFCYFIARMEDELKDDLNNKRLIIYIDDPISSLDSNHIFFMFSLIESIIAKPDKYGQLFISTHNLDFLKYLKKLTIPKYKPQPDSKPKEDINNFLIERKWRSNTHLRLAPKYLKNYVTEFNYLFEQVYKCSTSDEETITHSYQYNFGNNMRKFLEAYLFYKYPSQKLSTGQRMTKFFEEDAITMNLVNRVINEYSHLEERFDRGLEPIDVDAISKVSKAVIDKIKNIDPNQYSALVDSITE